MSRFDEVQKRWNVERFLRRHGYEMRLTETGEVHIKCPRCYDSKYRLYVNRAKKFWVCHHCGGKGRSAIGFVMWILKCDEDMAMRSIISSADSLLLDDDDEEERPRRRRQEASEVELPEGFKPLTLPTDRRSEPFWDYLTGRSITPTMVKEYGMGYCGRGEYRGRVIVPVNIFGVRRGWVGRTIHKDVTRKYMNPPGVHTSRLLFNIDHVVASGTETVVLMEGMFDVFRMNDVAVCTFGKKISNQQISILARTGIKRWVFCYDGDAWADGARYAQEVPSYVECFRAKLPKEYDPGEAPMMELTRAIHDAEYWNLTSDMQESVSTDKKNRAYYI